MKTKGVHVYSSDTHAGLNFHNETRVSSPRFSCYADYEQPHSPSEIVDFSYKRDCDTQKCLPLPSNPVIFKFYRPYKYA